MGRDYPDWGGRLKSQNQYLLYDLAELAARLGSPVTYERNGRVMWYTDFDHGLGEFQILTNGGGAVALVNENVFTGPYAVNISGPSASGQYAQIAARLPLVYSGIHAITFFLCPLLLGGHFKCIYQWYKWGVGYGSANLEFDFSRGYIQVLDSLGALIDVYDMGYAAFFDPRWLMVKWVLDIDNKKLLRLHVNDDTVNLEDYPIFTYATTLYLTSSTIVFRGDGQGDGAYSVNLDRIIYTVDEPGNDG